MQRLEGQACAAGSDRFLLCLVLPEHRDLSSLGRIGDGLEGVTRLWDTGQPQYLDRTRRADRLDLVAAIVDQGPNTADHGAGDEVVAHVERAILHQDGCNRTSPAVNFGFEDGSSRDPLRVGLVLAHFRNEQDHVEQSIEVVLLLR